MEAREKPKCFKRDYVGVLLCNRRQPKHVVLEREMLFQMNLGQGRIYALCLTGGGQYNPQGHQYNPQETVWIVLAPTSLDILSFVIRLGGGVFLELPRLN